MPRRVTIDDVARLAEVHKATVSRALNARTRDQVNAETLKRVKRAARQLGYVPNAMARGLRTSRSMTIGVIIPDLMNPIFPPIIRGIEHVLQPHGYTVLVANTDSHEDVESSAFESLLQRRVDGFILATGRLDDQSIIDDAAAADVPVVLVNRDSGAHTFPLVSGDNAGGIEAWSRLGEAVGLTRDALWSLEQVTPGVRFAVDAYVNFARRAPWQEAVCSSLTEMFAPQIHKDRLATWPQHYPWIDPDGLAYFRSRIPLAQRDVEHGLKVTLAHFTRRDQQERALTILQFKLDILWSMLDSIEKAFPA